MTIRTLLMSLILVWGSFFLSACARGRETSTPIPVLPTAPPQQIPTPTPGTSDEVWDRIRSTGTMVVGTSVDYPPFSFYTPDFRMDGYDIALIQRIGSVMGVNIEIKDFAFDGLIGALQIGQIDLAIAAISMTPERDQVVDFSNVYYVGEDAVVAATDSRVGEIIRPEDMAGLTVGVQLATVYEAWVEDILIEPGIIPAESMLVYSSNEQAVGDLSEGRFDVLILDLLPARIAAESGDVRVVGQGLNRQRFAMAMTEPSSTLRAEVNKALRQLQDAGVVAELAATYLDLNQEELIPLPTPEPPTPTPRPEATSTPVPTPLPTCIDGMAWVSDLTYDDRGMTAPPLVSPGQAFTKGWRVRNTGTCDWTEAFKLVYVSGNHPYAPMSGRPTFVRGNVPPGSTYDFYVDLIAPGDPGIYQGFWQMQDDVNIPFGERVWVGIQVPAPPTPTPAPTLPPSTGITFTVDRTQIRQGECVNFTWNVTNAREVYFYREGEDWRNHGVTGSETRTVCPPYTSAHFLRVVRGDGGVEERAITIYVEPAAIAPPSITLFSTEPQRIPAGSCLVVRWEVVGNAERVNLYSDNVPLWLGAPIRASLNECPPRTGQITYTLEVLGPGGTARTESDVFVGIQP